MRLDILIVDRPTQSRQWAAAQLTRAGFRVHLAESFARAEELLDRIPVALVITERYVRREDGLQFLRRLKRSGRVRLRVLWTESLDMVSTLEAVNSAHIDYLFPKPIDAEYFVGAVKQLTSFLARRDLVARRSRRAAPALPDGPRPAAVRRRVTAGVALASRLRATARHRPRPRRATV